MLCRGSCKYHDILRDLIFRKAEVRDCRSASGQDFIVWSQLRSYSCVPSRLQLARRHFLNHQIHIYVVPATNYFLLYCRALVILAAEVRHAASGVVAEYLPGSLQANEWDVEAYAVDVWEHTPARVQAYFLVYLSYLLRLHILLQYG